MNKRYYLLTIFLLLSCATDSIENQNIKGMVFSNIQSDFEMQNIHNMPCDKIDKGVIEHVLKTGVPLTVRDIHDEYSTVGCSVTGSIDINGKPARFQFDYGGYIYLGDEHIIGCAEQCCANNFIYCTWDKNGLAG